MHAPLVKAVVRRAVAGQGQTSTVHSYEPRHPEVRAWLS